MKREDWLFTYQGKELHQTVSKKLTYLNERLMYWTKAQTQVEAEIKEKGFKVSSFEITGGHRADVQIDPTLLKRLSESQSKLAKYRKDIEEAEIWERALQREPDRFFDLEPQDIRYFGL